MAKILDLYASWILDSRGLPTVSCQIIIEQNGKKAFAKASVPSGASTGTHEALELRDKGGEFHGKGVNKAVENVNTKIAEKVLNKEFVSAEELDQYVLDMDKSGNKSKLGANAILAVSMAAHRVYANLYELPLWQYLRRLYFSTLPAVTKFPKLTCNVINGGEHADNGLSIQEFMIVPSTSDVKSDVRLASEVYHTLKKNLHNDEKSIALGDEGGFAPNLEGGTKDALKYLQKAIEDSGYTQADCGIALDCAASEFYDKEKDSYNVDGKEYTKSGLTNFYKELNDEFNLISIEDGFDEDDILGWQVMTETIGQKVKLIGDDLFVTNPKRFEEVGLKNKIANGVLIKLNQIGSVLETCKMINDAKNNNYVTSISHRSGETVDDFISDLAIASQSEFIKLGAPARGERVAKFNRLLEIKDSLE